jgi:LEA14-like dessication related protein
MFQTVKSRFFFIGSFLVCVLSACTTLSDPIEAPQVSIADLRLNEVTLFEQQYSLRLRVKNPNPFDVPVTGMAFTLKLNGIDFARGVSRESVRLPAYGEELLDVDVTSNLASVMKQMNTQRESPGGQLDYELAGHVGVSGVPGRIEFSDRGRLGLGAPR